MSGAARRASEAALVAAAALFVVSVRVLVASRGELLAAEALLSSPSAAAPGSADRQRAIEGLGRAARMDAPGNPWSARALVRLEEIAASDEASGAQAEALTAWRQVRSAVLATRGAFERPAKDRARARADERIAALMAHLESPALDPGADEAARTRWHAARLAEDDAPSVGWSVVALLGALGLLGAALLFVWRGLDDRLRLRAGPAVLCAAAFVIGFALFVIGLARA